MPNMATNLSNGAMAPQLTLYRHQRDGDITVTAEFAPIEYTITYHLTAVPIILTTRYLHHRKQNHYFEGCYRTGYTFEGWYDAASDGNEVTQIAKGSTGNIDLYAY